MTPPPWAEALRHAVLDLHLQQVADRHDGGRPLRQPPSLDLAVVALPPSGPPQGVNLLFSREHPEGLLAPFSPQLGAVQGVAFHGDVRDAQLDSHAWAPGADWSRLDFPHLHGHGPRHVAPYPASVCKLMVAAGVGWCADTQSLRLDAPWPHDGRSRPLHDWLFDMLAESCNTSTSALVAWLHAHQGLEPLHALFIRLDLPTLRLRGTQPDGGWGNAAGAGVGQIHMTAWDALRLLWWMGQGQLDAPPCPWLAADAPRLQPATAALLWRGLWEQGRDVVLSSSLLAGLPGTVPGIPCAVHPRWAHPAGGWQVAGQHYPPPTGPVASTTVRFAHKVGNTDNYAADCGWVQGLGPQRRRYFVAFMSNLGARYRPPGPGEHLRVCDPRIAQLGASIDRLMAGLQEGTPPA